MIKLGGVRGLAAKVALTGIGLSALLGTGCLPKDLHVKPNTQLKYMSFGEPVKYQHKTHPDDASFLSGNPGTTEIKDAEMFGIGVEASNKFGFFEPYMGGRLVFVGGEDRHQNDNDPRAPEQGSFVYSKLVPVAPQISAGASFYFTADISVGAEISAIWLNREDGWDRWGNDQASHHSSFWVVEAGPRIRYRIADHAIIEFGVDKGLNTNTTSGLLSFGFDL